MIHVMASRVSSRHSNRRGMGMGSNSQCFGADFKMKVFTSVSVTGWKHENEKGSWFSGTWLEFLTVQVNPYCSDFVQETPQWGAADAEIKVPSGENTELKRSPFKAWSRSVYSHTCSAYCQGFPPCLFLPFQSIHQHFFPKPLRIFFLCWLWLTPVPV